jgi:hypothetical protein
MMVSSSLYSRPLSLFRRRTTFFTYSCNVQGAIVASVAVVRRAVAFPACCLSNVMLT